MGFIDSMKARVDKAAPGLTEKATAALVAAKTMAADAAEKAAPIIKDATNKATAYAQEKTPILKAQAMQALDDAKKNRAALKLKAAHDAEARAEYERVMFDTALTATHPDFICEPFNHFNTTLDFMAVTGEVLESVKRSDVTVAAGSSAGGSSYGSSSNLMSACLGNSSAYATASSYLHANTKTIHEFWIKNGDIEEAIVLGDSQIPMRQGQRVTLVYVARTTDKSSALCLIYNHSSKKGHQVLSPDEINNYLRIYTEQPGMFNGKKVNATKNRLLLQLGIRLNDLCVWADANQSGVNTLVLDG